MLHCAVLARMVPYSTLGFGLMGLSMIYGQAPSDLERFVVLGRALELGVTYWDTSE